MTIPPEIRPDYGIMTNPPTPTPARTPVRVWVRDIALILASLCVVLLTALLIWAWASVGSALSEVGTPADPAPTWECTPTPDWPC